MRRVRRAGLIFLAAVAACAKPQGTAQGGAEVKKPECRDCATPPIPVSDLPKTEEEWRKKLSPERFTILRRRGTEPPYSGEYLKHQEDGLYTCAGCGQPLYDSKTKYDSCGWPSFWDSIPGAVSFREPGSLEAICARCQGHLGHIFDDGPPPTGKRH